MQLTRNPFQRMAAGCALLALIVSLTVYPPASVPILMVGLAFGLRARSEPPTEHRPMSGGRRPG
jgi:hypothetical protein